MPIDMKKQQFEIGQAVVRAYYEVSLYQLETAYRTCISALAEQYAASARSPEQNLEELFGVVEEQLRLAFTTSLFHWWEKEAQRITKTKYYSHNRIMEYLANKGLEVDGNPIDVLHHVVNAAKHGDGASMDKLKNDHPEFLENGEVVISERDIEGFFAMFKTWSFRRYGEDCPQ